MSVAGHSPPPFFRRGPAPLAQLAAYALLSIALIVADVRFDALQQVRTVSGIALSPIQQVIAFPTQVVERIATYFTRLTSALDALRASEREQLEAGPLLLRQRYLEDENQRLRNLLDLRQYLGVQGRVATVLFVARDAFSRHVIVDKGSSDGINNGDAVIDADGVIGQVVRTYPLTAEVALLTDSNQAIPVRIARNGLRAVLFGAGDGRLELRYLAANADVQANDLVETSGLDGVYLPGLPVARVIGRDDKGDYSFARVLCTPVSGIESQTTVMIVPPPAIAIKRPEGFESVTARNGGSDKPRTAPAGGRQP